MGPIWNPVALPIWVPYRLLWVVEIKKENRVDAQAGQRLCGLHAISGFS